MIITRTPFRLSFFGGGSDYPVWYTEHGGRVLGATINKYCWLTVRHTPPFGKPYKVVYCRMEECNSIDEIKHPAIRATLHEMACPARVEIYHTSDLPARSGVGSSSAFVVGLVRALAALDADYWTDKKVTWTPALVADMATTIEQERCLETVGAQDQVLCAYGGMNLVEFPANTTDLPVVTPLYLPRALRLLQERLLLFYTGIQRLASDVASSYVGELHRRPATMQRLTAMVDEGARVLRALERGDGYMDNFGHLLHEAWLLKKSLGAGISTDSINAMYDTAKSAGAIGGKLLGAGGGGFLLLYVEPDRQEAVRRALAGLKEVPFKFEHEGATVVYCGSAA